MNTSERIPTVTRALNLAPPYIIVKGRNGLFVVNKNDRFLGKCMLAYGEVCPEEDLLYSTILQEGDFVLEPGANIGAHTIGISKTVGATGQVVAFEPLIHNFHLLATNITLNSITNVDIHQMGCSDQQGDMPHPIIDHTKLFNFGGISLIDGTGDYGKVKFDENIRIPIVTLDDFILQGRHKSRRVKLIKADVENMEIHILRGSQQIINRDRPILYVENNPIHTWQNLIVYIQDLGYNLWWHLPRLIVKNNYFKNPQNILGPTFSSANLLCLPQAINLSSKISNLVTLLPVNKENLFHPLSNKPAATSELK